MDASVMMGTTSSITMQSLWKIVQRAPAVGAKMWCVFFFSVRVRSAVRSRGAYIRTRIALPFIGRFLRGLQRFFRKELQFQTRYKVITFIARWRHNFR